MTPVRRAPETRTSKSAIPARVAASTAPASPRFLGSLAVRSEPRGALVLVDGQVVGVTPILLKGVRAGSRVIRIESEGYERWSSAARVVANRETAIVATLQRN
jgi:PEGA domain.